jgi:hypothetical protein
MQPFNIVLSGSLVTMEWLVLGLQMEEMASRYGVAANILNNESQTAVQLGGWAWG